MTVVVYDGRFAGLLTAIFEVYEYIMDQPIIQRNDTANRSLFGSMHTVITDIGKRKRVYKKLQERLSPKALKQLRDAYLSEIKDIGNVLLRYTQYAFNTSIAVENDYANADVLMVQQTSRKVHKENTAWKPSFAFSSPKISCIIPSFNRTTMCCH